MKHLILFSSEEFLTVVKKITLQVIDFDGKFYHCTINLSTPQDVQALFHAGIEHGIHLSFPKIKNTQNEPS